MKDYHRLDIGLTWSHYNRRNNKVDWNFSVYNLYNRHNPVFYYYNSNSSIDFYNPKWNQDYKPLSLYQVSLFPVIPSVSYKVYFDPVAKRARTAAEKAILLQKANESRQGLSDNSTGADVKGRWNIKVGYPLILHSGTKYDPYRFSKFNLELNYGFLRNIEAGIYGGYSKVRLIEQIPQAGFMQYTTNAISFGLNCNFHLLPYIVKKDDSKVDLYINGKLGGVAIKSKPIYEQHSIGGGALVYLSRHVGVFGEYAYGKFYKKPDSKVIFHMKAPNDKVTFGLSVKFK